MMCGTLLLITLASSVWGIPLSHEEALFVQAEENSSVTVEWRFASKSGIMIPSLKIHCVHLPDLKVFFSLDNSVEEDQDEQFAGRLQCDEEALTTGRVRLRLSRVRMDDSGKYLCRMATDFGRKVKEFALNIVRLQLPDKDNHHGNNHAVRTEAATKEPSVVTEAPEPARRDRISLFVGLGLVVAAVAALAVSR